MSESLEIVILGLSITSSWGNGHATTYRGLVKALAEQGHRVTFLERDVPWYRNQRDLPNPGYCRTELYQDSEDLRMRFAGEVRQADAIIVGSYVPSGVQVGEWVLRTASGLVAFYDIDTPVTMAKLKRGDFEYLSPELIPQYHLYLSFSGGNTLQYLERVHGSPKALPLYCSVDPDLYFAEPSDLIWDLGYMGTYSDDRQPTLDRLLTQPAAAWTDGRFVVAGPQYPDQIQWPPNVKRIEHLPPVSHRSFYNSQRFALNVTRQDMIQAGYSPSVRLFEAAACGVPIISDYWEGLDSFFTLGSEILVADSSTRVLEILRDLSEADRRSLAANAMRRVSAEHTAAHRARQLAGYLRSDVQSMTMGALR